MSLDRELGKIQASLESLTKGQETVLALIGDYAKTAQARLDRHEELDNEHFKAIWKGLTKLQSRMAYISGGCGIIFLLAELYFKS